MHSCITRGRWLMEDHPKFPQPTGVSVKFEVGGPLSRVTDCISKGPNIPFH